MLSSVTDLLRYIDENQLTSEFGGTLDYCHSDWIVLRTVSPEQLSDSAGAELSDMFFVRNREGLFFFLLRSFSYPCRLSRVLL